MATDILTALRLRGPTQAGELLKALGVSRPTLMRLVRSAGDHVVVRGSARRTTYAARRALRGSHAPLPLYRVDGQGDVTQVAQLDLTHPEGCAMEFLADFGWPLDDAMQAGWFDGLPYPLHDMRPQGFLGRRFARHHAEMLQVPQDPASWSDDHALHAMSLLGSDLPGEFIVGESACRRWLDRIQDARLDQGESAIADAELAQAYAARAEAAMGQGVVGSSAGGEFPKFTAMRAFADEQVQQVLVKFSGSDDSPGTRRWADLLVCEHLAGQVLPKQLGIAAARSRIHRFGGRTYLEVDRFDRHGPLGRSGVVSWGALNGALFGPAGVPWT
ncbi:MAG: HipA domain-containing protein, partial [Rubrivivax sp.]|nr:HipA domain-containing protein [Rubrivivax sp.]